LKSGQKPQNRWDQFYQLIENQAVKFKIFKNLKAFEIKKIKKLELILIFLVKTKFKNSK
jgi:hypothetical protein